MVNQILKINLIVLILILCTIYEYIMFNEELIICVCFFSIFFISYPTISVYLNNFYLEDKVKFLNNCIEDIVLNINIIKNLYKFVYNYEIIIQFFFQIMNFLFYFLNFQINFFENLKNIYLNEFLYVILLQSISNYEKVIFYNWNFYFLEKFDFLVSAEANIFIELTSAYNEVNVFIGETNLLIFNKFF